MKLREFFARGTVRATMAFCLTLALVSLYAASARTQWQSQTQSQSQESQSQAQTGSSSSAPTQSDDAAAKAAERKRKFDEQRKLMEGGYSPSKEESHRSDPYLTLSPSDVNLLVHDRVQIRLYDKGTEVTDASWSAFPGTVVGSWFSKGVFTLEAKGPGTARVGAVIGSRSTSVVVHVYPGDKMPKGIERTSEALKPSGSQ